MSPAEEKLRRDVALGALARIAEGKALSRSELFSDSRLKGSTYRKQDDWQRRVLRYLDTRGIVERSGGISGRYVVYKLVDANGSAKRLEEFAESPDFTTVLFTETAPEMGTGIEDVLLGRELGEEPLGEDGGDGGDGGSGERSEGDLRLDFALKLLAGVLEIVLDIQAKLDVQGERLKKLEEAFR